MHEIERKFFQQLQTNVKKESNTTTKTLYFIKNVHILFNRLVRVKFKDEDCVIGYI